MAAHAPEELHALLEAAFNARDLDAFVELHDEDATALVPPAGTRVSGRDAIRAALEPTFDLQPRARIEVTGKLEGAALAVTHARWSLAGTAPDGAPVEMSGRGTIVSRRRPDGTWRIVLDNPLTPD
jgi:uncharacterized protein (TIGR02246 family)